MSEPIQAHPDRTMRQAVEIAVRLLVIAVVLTWSFQIVAPFINPIVWAAVIAVAIYPIFVKLTGWVGGRRKFAATLIVLLGIGIVVVPMVVMSSSLIESVQLVGEKVKAGTLEVPPPPAKVRDWPVVGKQVTRSGPWRRAISRPSSRSTGHR